MFILNPMLLPTLTTLKFLFILAVWSRRQKKIKASLSPRNQSIILQGSQIVACTRKKAYIQQIEHNRFKLTWERVIFLKTKRLSPIWTFINLDLLETSTIWDKTTRRVYTRKIGLHILILKLNLLQCIFPITEEINPKAHHPLYRLMSAHTHLINVIAAKFYISQKNIR